MASYVLVLTWLNPNRTNIAGIYFPERGEITDPNYSRDKSILNGICGTLWGQHMTEQWFDQSYDTIWTVIRTQWNAELVTLDKLDNFVKFKTGTIVMSGDYYDCMNHILKCEENMICM